MIHFETLPLLNEAQSIRKALYQLYQNYPAIEKKPFWLSFVFPAGILPQSLHPGFENRQEAFNPETIARTIFTNQEGMELPQGIGINCTKIKWLQEIIEGYGKGIDRLHEAERWLALYPDGGGSVYDPASQVNCLLLLH